MARTLLYAVVMRLNVALTSLLFAACVGSGDTVDGLDLDAEPTPADPLGKADGDGTASVVVGWVADADLRSGGVVPMYDDRGAPAGQLDVDYHLALTEQERGGLIIGTGRMPGAGKGDELFPFEPCPEGYYSIPSSWDGCQRMVTGVRNGGSGSGNPSMFLAYEVQSPEGVVSHPFAERTWWGWGYEIEVIKPARLFHYHKGDGAFRLNDVVLPMGARYDYDDDNVRSGTLSDGSVVLFLHLSDYYLRR